MVMVAWGKLVQPKSSPLFESDYLCRQDLVDWHCWLGALTAASTCYNMNGEETVIVIFHKNAQTKR